MRIIITCEEEAIPAAMQLLQNEIADNWERRYDRPGWGWHFRSQGIRFFVRGIKNGISLTQRRG